MKCKRIEGGRKCRRKTHAAWAEFCAIHDAENALTAASHAIANSRTEVLRRAIAWREDDSFSNRDALVAAVDAHAQACADHELAFLRERGLRRDDRGIMGDR